jgi:hypothetical protein
VYTRAFVILRVSRVRERFLEIDLTTAERPATLDLSTNERVVMETENKREVGVCEKHPTEKALKSANGFIDCPACWYDKNRKMER